MVHRDIWPANVFLTTPDTNRYPTVVLADFGSSISRDDIVAGRNVSSGQQRYFAPPEQSISRYKSDIYQVALVVVAMCRQTLRPKDLDSTFGSWPAGSTYSARLNQLLASCLKTDPSRRMAAVDLNHHLSSEEWRTRQGNNRRLHLQTGVEDRRLGTLGWISGWVNC